MGRSRPRSENDAKTILARTVFDRPQFRRNTGRERHRSGPPYGNGWRQGSAKRTQLPDAAVWTGRSFTRRLAPRLTVTVTVSSARGHA